jgi:hypothetical protein
MRAQLVLAIVVLTAGQAPAMPAAARPTLGQRVAGLRDGWRARRQLRAQQKIAVEQFADWASSNRMTQRLEKLEQDARWMSPLSHGLMLNTLASGFAALAAAPSPKYLLWPLASFVAGLISYERDYARAIPQIRRALLDDVRHRAPSRGIVERWVELGIVAPEADTAK